MTQTGSAQRLHIAILARPWSDIPPSGYGGLEMACAGLIEALIDRGHEVTLIGAGRNGTRAHFVQTYAEHTLARLGDLMPELVHVAHANRWLGGIDPSVDIVHDNTMVGVFSAASRPCASVVTVHHPVHKPFYGEHGDYLEQFRDTIPLVAISASQRRLRPSLNWAATVHHGVNVDRFPFFLEKDENAVWVGRFNLEKGPHLAISAAEAAGVPLILAGKCTEGEEKEFFKDVIKPMLSNNVEVILNPERDITENLLARARCLLLPITWEEPFGMVFIEAMACGTPVVAMKHGSVPEIVEHGVTGIVCEHENELPDALQTVKSIDPATCRQHIRDHFSTEVMACNYEQVYLNAIKSWWSHRNQ